MERKGCDNKQQKEIPIPSAVLLLGDIAPTHKCTTARQIKDCGKKSRNNK